MAEEKEPATIEDSILAGILKTMGLTVTGHVNGNGRVLFHINGDYTGALSKIYENTPIASLDAIQNIKTCRQMIFALKNQGHGKENGYAKHKGT